MGRRPVVDQALAWLVRDWGRRLRFQSPLDMRQAVRRASAGRSLRRPVVRVQSQGSHNVWGPKRVVSSGSSGAAASTGAYTTTNVRATATGILLCAVVPDPWGLPVLAVA